MLGNSKTRKTCTDKIASVWLIIFFKIYRRAPWKLGGITWSTWRESLFRAFDSILRHLLARLPVHTSRFKPKLHAFNVNEMTAPKRRLRTLWFTLANDKYKTSSTEAIQHLVLMPSVSVCENFRRTPCQGFLLHCKQLISNMFRVVRSCGVASVCEKFWRLEEVSNVRGVLAAAQRLFVFECWLGHPPTSAWNHMQFPNT